MSPEEVALLRKLVADLEEQNSKLQAGKDKTEKEHAAAEANLSALKTQARGLENEYDRLLAENDQLKTRLARAGLGEPVAAGGFAKKDE
jgi:chromosome segregation ATPase